MFAWAQISSRVVRVPHTMSKSSEYASSLRTSRPMNVPSGSGKHTVERLTLTADRVRLRYDFTVEDPAYLAGPATLTQQWDHRPDLEFSQDTEGCDKDVAARYKDSVPK